MKFIFLTGFISFLSLVSSAQKVIVISPNQKVIIMLFNKQNMDNGEWYLKVNYANNGKETEILPEIDLGLVRSDQDFSKNLKFIKAGKSIFVKEQYTTLHGKRYQCSNSAN
ncbi:MAG TPA: glycoside hydrolase family 97 N-terminal domain-containing protein, partial [Bacteroidales bacterium]